jgi:hypothetical protein
MDLKIYSCRIPLGQDKVVTPNQQFESITSGHKP